MFETAVGMSRQWDAYSAGREVGEEVWGKMHNAPKFVLFFSSIHYKKNGGFNKLLEGFYSVVPKEVKLVGGTVAGFINNNGVFTRGATALAVYSDEMDVATGIGHNTKRAPEMAGRRCAETIKSGLEKSGYKNKYVFEFTCSGLVPSLPFIGSKRVMKMPKLLSRLTILGLSFATRTMQIGVGREDDVVRKMSEVLDEFTVLGGSTLDNNKWEFSYQFFNNKAYTNSVVAVGIQSDLESVFSSSSGLKPTGVKMKPTKVGLYGCAIESIEGKPAAEAVREKLGWPKDFYDENLHRRTLYYPLCYEQEGEVSSRVMALIVGDDIVFTNVVGDNELEVNHASGKSLIECVDAGLEETAEFKDRSVFAFIVSCCARLEALGAQTYKVHERVEKSLDGVPFLGIYASGEDVRVPGKRHNRLNETFNLVSFYKRP